MPNLLLIDYLQRSRAQFSVHNVPAAYTAEESARLARVVARRFTKVVMVHIDAELAMVVMPAHFHLVPQALCEELKAQRIELATEREFKRQFPRCEVGAIPPFGHLFGVRAFMVNAFDEFGDIFCKSGTHDELLRMPATEFRRMARPDIIESGASLRLRGSSHARLQRLLKASPQQTLLPRAPLLKQVGYLAS